MHVSKVLFIEKIFRGEKYYNENIKGDKYKNIFTYYVSVYIIKKKGYASIPQKKKLLHFTRI